MDEVRVWDTASLKATTKWLHHDKVIWMQLSSDGKTAFTGSETDLRLWDVATSSVRFEKKSGGKTIRFAAINPDASRMLTVFRDNSATAELWDAGSGRRVGKLLHKSPIVYARFDSAGKKLVTCELAGGRPFHLWDAKTGDALSKPIASDFVTESQDAVRAAFGANNKRCVFARQNGFAIADSTTGEILLTGHLDGNVETDSVAFAADGGKIALLTRSAVDHERSAVQVFDARTGKLVCSVASGTAWCDISPDGGRLLCGMTERPAELWDIDKGRKLQSFLGNVAYDAAANWQANIIAFGVDDHTSIWRHARK
ncbi:MAG TPA: WD40 repeat domain-containing protein [Tepidisphaeraceae bacterium]|nr:WD40 repeat domain-containing protein [Tepidisphaeraceae bacterium]